MHMVIWSYCNLVIVIIVIVILLYSHMALRQNRVTGDSGDVVTVVLTIATWGPSGTLYIYIYTAHIPAQKKTSITKTIKNNIYIYIYIRRISRRRRTFFWLTR